MMKQEKYIKNRAKEKLRTMLFSIGLLFWLAGCNGADEAVIINLSEDALQTNKSEESNLEQSDGNDTICVYVCGAVKEPGVVEIPADSRVQDALLAAGGFAEDACMDYVNLAARLTDGEMLYFPDVLEGEALMKSKEQEKSGLVDINHADVSELCTLPGIGETKAEAIVTYRESHGIFQKTEDIINVPGIKTQAYEQIKDKITVE